MTRLRAKSALIIIAISAIGFCIWKLQPAFHAAQSPVAAAPTHTQTASKTAPPMSTPAVLRIPKLGLRAKVQAVGLNPQGNMGAPRNLLDVSWYKGSALPGNKGNAVIAGHSGQPHQTAFWNLESLHVGDKIEVVDVNGTLAQFTVTNVQRVAPDVATREHIFGQTDQTHLNLITCDGSWDKASKSYSERLIVFSSRIN